MLEANKDNSKIIPKSLSIKLSKAYGLVISSFNFQHIIMADCNALENNHMLLDWFRTQAITIKNKKSIIILKMSQVRKEAFFHLF
jgi:hypothetical protein